jgi:hypothetical protein
VNGVDLIKRVALITVVVLVGLGLVPDASVSTARGPRHRGWGHNHHRMLRSEQDPLAYFRPKGYDGFPARRNGNGRRGSGGRAVAHHAGGVRIASARAVSAAPDGRFYRLGINGWEPTIGVDDKGRVFYQARFSNLEPQVLRSTNEGDTWKIVSPTIAGQNTQPQSLDPIMYLDKDTGRLFTNNIPADVFCQYVSFSDNAGKSWTNTYICGHFDHQNIFTGPPPKGGDKPMGYKNVVYYCAINLVALSGTSTATTCSRSLNGGLTWIHTGEPAYLTPIPPRDDQNSTWCDGAVGHGFVGPDGSVYLPRVWCGQPYVSISRDEGLTWDAVQIAKNGGRGHEAGIAADGRGNLYYTWVAKNGLPYLSISRNRGKTWGKPLVIGPPGLKRASLPAIDIGGTGKIAITYAGSETPGNKRKSWTWNGYITMTAGALARKPVFYTGTINAKSDPLQKGTCGSVRCHTLGDFFDVTIGPDGTPWAAFVDACFKPGYCVPTFEAVGVRGEAVVGRLVGGPKLR